MSNSEFADPILVQKLSVILEEILSNGVADLTGKDITNDSFSVLGVNSVDYIEFVLNVERRLGIDISDEAMMDPALNSIALWADHLQNSYRVLDVPES